MKQRWEHLVSRLSTAQATLIVVLTAVCFGTVPWFAGELLREGIASPAIAFYRYMLTAVLFFSILKFNREKRRETLWALFSGACVGMGWISYVEALKVVPVSSVSVIYMTYPLFTLLASWLLIGNKPGARSIGAAVGLLPLLFGYEFNEVVPANPRHWIYIAALALFTALVPQYLYSTLAPSIGPAKSAMAGSIELPTMFVVGVLAFGESIGMLQIAAGVLVMSAILITPAISSHRRVVHFDTDSEVSVIADDAYEDWEPPADTPVDREHLPEVTTDARKS